MKNNNYQDQFIAFLNCGGYELANRFIANKSDTWERLRYMGEKKTSGRYLFVHEGEKCIAFYGSDKSPDKFEVWYPEHVKELTEAQKAEQNKWYEEKRKEIQAAEKQRQREIMQELDVDLYLYDKAHHDHGYLVKKNIKPYGALQRDGDLVLPIYQKDGQKWSAQYISEDGYKKYHTGGRLKGGFYAIDGDTDAIFVCEGFSTGASIAEATDRRVYIAFQANNLRNVAKMVCSEYPSVQIIIAADNDAWTKIGGKPHNTGLVQAEEAQKVNPERISIAFPEFKKEDLQEKPTDWNDFVNLYGHKKAAKVLLSSLVRCTSVGEENDGLVSSKSDSPTNLPATIPLKKTEQIDPIDKNILVQELEVQQTHVDDHKRYNDDNWTNFLFWKNKELAIYDEKFSLHNAILICTYQGAFRGTFVYDDFSKVERIIKPLPHDDPVNFHWRTLTDNDLTHMRAYMLRQGVKVGSNTEMKNIISCAAEKYKIHPVRTYFKSLVWDKKPRLDNWLIDYCNAHEQDAAYIRAVGACMLKASVKRIFKPGEPFHHMPVFEGAQAAGKSSAFKALSTFNGVSYFADHLSFDAIDNPHVAQHLVGNLFIEFQEMSGSTTKDRNKVKAWLTMEKDKVQPKFSNTIVEYPRQFVPVGTTNDATWLNDPTGGRRFWPIKVARIDINGINAVKEQLWAEAVHRVLVENELHYIENSDPVYAKMEAEQAERYIGHAWEDTIAEWLVDNAAHEVVTTEKIMEKALFIQKVHWNRSNRADVNDILRSLGYDNKPVWDARLRKTVRQWTKK